MAERSARGQRLKNVCFPGSPLRNARSVGAPRQLACGSQVIRAHSVRRVNDERGRAPLTCSLRPC